MLFSHGPKDKNVIVLLWLKYLYLNLPITDINIGIFYIWYFIFFGNRKLFSGLKNYFFCPQNTNQINLVTYDLKVILDLRGFLWRWGRTSTGSGCAGWTLFHCVLSGLFEVGFNSGLVIMIVRQIILRFLK